jgi:hypothetical protein
MMDAILHEGYLSLLKRYANSEKYPQMYDEHRVYDRELLAPIVSRGRYGNTYCRHNIEDFEMDTYFYAPDDHAIEAIYGKSQGLMLEYIDSRYRMVNYNSYSEHGTIEIRLLDAQNHNPERYYKMLELLSIVWCEALEAHEATCEYDVSCSGAVVTLGAIRKCVAKVTQVTKELWALMPLE